MKIRSKRFIGWFPVVAAMALWLGACNDDDSAWMSLSRSVLFVDGWGVTEKVSFSGEDLRDVVLTGIPAGWKIEADLQTATLTVTSPADSGSEAMQRSGTVSVIGHSTSGKSIVRMLFVSVAGTEDLTPRQSNCFALTSPYTIYSFDATRRGETSETLPTADVRLIWQTGEKLVRYLAYADGRASFYIDGEQGALRGGNALVGAYDAAGNLLWSWHLWMVDAARLQAETYANGKTFLTLNLGAVDNTHATHDEILGSFGCFYQWGRKDPFVGSETYDAAQGRDAALYDEEGNGVKLKYEPSTAQTGTTAYASAHPATYLLGAETNGFDWLYAPAAEPLWAERKTVYDPCPKGWRVPSEHDLEGLRIVDAAAGSVSQYGWMLSDGTVEVFYPGAGFRTYLTGRVQNVYNPVSGVEVPQPWVGFYWTGGVQAPLASAFSFWFDAEDASRSGVEAVSWQKRANGMPVRCVKE